MYTPEQILQTVYYAVRSSNLYTENIEKRIDISAQALQTVAAFNEVKYENAPTKINGLQRTSSPKTKSNNLQKFDLLLDPIRYWCTHGYTVKQGHNSATYTRKKPGHQDNAMQMDIMGGSTANKKWIHPHCIIAAATTDNNNNTNDELNVYFNSQIINSVVSTPSSTQKHIDLGATDH